MSEPRIVTPEEDTATALVCAMHESADCPVTIGNGSYSHANLLAEHLAPVVDARTCAAAEKAWQQAVEWFAMRGPRVPILLLLEAEEENPYSAGATENDADPA